MTIFTQTLMIGITADHRGSTSSEREGPLHQ